MAKQLNVNLAFTADTSQAKAQLQDLQNQLTKLSTSPLSASGFKSITPELQKASIAAAELKIHLEQATNVNTGTLDFSRLNQSLKQSGASLTEYASKIKSMGPAGQQAFMSLAQSVANAEVPIRRSNMALTNMLTTLKNTARWQISSSVLHGFMGAIQSAYGYSQKLNESLNNIRIVTGKSSEEMAQFAEKANKAARALSSTTTQYTDAALIYYQQGLDGVQVEQRAETTLKLANVSRQSAEVVSDQMTAIWNNFDDGSKSLEYYADVLTALGAATASSTDEIAQGLEKFSAIAETVGLSYEYATAALATVTAETRQSADVVGTAFKTLFARMEGLKLGETLEDGTDLNKYSEALASVGINIKDSNGELRDMDSILDDMGSKWQTLSKDQQVALAQTVGGMRQYNQLIALMGNWDEFQKNLSIAYNSTGTLDEQAETYAESWEAAQKRVTAAAEAIYSKIISDDFFIDLLNDVEDLLTGFGKLIDAAGGFGGILSSLGVILTKVFQDKIAQSLRDMAYNLKMSTKYGQEMEQQAKRKTLSDMATMMKNSSSLAGTQSENVASKVYADQLQMQERFMENQKNMSEFEQKRTQQLMDQLKIQGEMKISAQQKKDAAAQNTSQIVSSMQGSLALQGDKAGLSTSQVRDLYTELTKVLSPIKEISTTTQTVKNLFGQMPADAEITGTFIDKIQEELTKLPSDLISETDLKQIEQMGQEAATMEEYFEKVVSHLGKIRGEAIAKATTVGKYKISAKQVNDYADSVDQQTEAANQAATAEEGRKMALDAVAESMDKAEGKTIDWANTLTSFASGLMSLTSLVKSAQGAIDALTNPELSGWEKFWSVLSSSGMILTSLVMTISSMTAVMKVLNRETIINTVNKAASTAANWASWASEKAVEKAKRKTAQASDLKEKEVEEETAAVNKNTASNVANSMSEYTSKKGNKYTKFTGSDGNTYLKGKNDAIHRLDGKIAKQLNKNQSTKLLGEYNQQLTGSSKLMQGATQSTNGLKNAFSGLKTSLGKLISSYKGVIAKTGLVAAGIAVLIGSISLAINQYNRQEKAAAKAAEAAQKASESYSKAREAYDAFAQTISNYQDGVKGLQSLTKGTLEYREAVLKANESAIQLLDTHEQLLYEINSDGLIEINKASLKMIQEQQLDILEAQLRNKQLMDLKAEEAKLNYESTQFQRKKIKSTSDFWWGLGNIGTMGVAGAGAGALIGTAIQPGYGSLIGAAIGGVSGLIGGTIATAASGVATKSEEDALNKLSAAYEIQGNAIFASNDELKQTLEDLRIADTKLIESLVDNKEATQELITEMQTQKNANMALYQDQVTQIYSEDFEEMNASDKEIYSILLGNQLYANTEKEKEQYEGMSENDLYELYAKIMGYNSNHIETKGNKATFYNGKGEIVVDSITTEDIIDSLAFNEASSAMKDLNIETNETIKMFKELVNSGNAASEALAQFLIYKNFSGNTQGELDSIITAITGTTDVNNLTDENLEAYLGSSFGDKNGVFTDEEAALFGVATVNEAIDKFSNSLSSASIAWGEFDSNVTSVISKDLMKNVSLGGAQSIQNIFDNLGDTDDIEFKNNLIQVLNGMSEKNQTLIIDAFAGLDWTQQDAADNFYQKLQDNNIGISDSIRNMVSNLQIANGVISTFDLSTIQKEVAKTEKVINNLNIGDTISSENYETLPDILKSCFTQLNDGSYQLLITAQELSNLYFKHQTSKISKDVQQAKLEAEQAQRDYNQAQTANPEPDRISTEVAVTMVEGVANPDEVTPEQLGYISEVDFDLYWKQLSKIYEEGYITPELYEEYVDEGKRMENAETLVSIDFDDTTAKDISNKLKQFYEDIDIKYKENVETTRKNYEQLSFQLAATATDLKQLNEIMDSGTLRIEDYTRRWIELNRVADLEGIDTEQLDEYTEYLQETMDLTEEQARVQAKATLKMNKGVESLSDNIDDWSNIINKSSKNSEEYFTSITSLRTAIAQLLDVSEDMIDLDWLSSADNLALIKEAAEGDAEAIDNLRASLLEDFILHLDLDSAALATFKENLADIQNDIKTYFKFVPEIDNASFIKSLNTMVTAASFNVEQIDSLLDGMGYEAVYEEDNAEVVNKVPVYRTYTTLPQIQEGTFDLFNLGGIVTYQDSWTEVTDEKEIKGSVPITSVQYNSTSGNGEKKTPKIQKIIKKPTGSANNSSSKNPGTSGGSKSSNKAKKVDRTKKSDVVNRYEEIEDKLDDIRNTADKAAEAMDRLYGENRIKAMKDQAKILEDEVGLLKDKRKQAEQYLKKDTEALAKAATGAGVRFEFDEKGNVTNYTEQMTRLYDQLAAVEAHMDTLGTKEEQDDYQETHVQPIQDAIDVLKEEYDGYKETRELIEDLDTEIQEAIYAWQDANAEILNYEIELKTELSEKELKKLDYYLGKMEDDFYSMAEGAALIGEKIKITNNALADSQTNFDNINELYNIINEDTGVRGMSDVAYVEALKNEQDALYSNLETLQELDDTMMNYYGDTLDRAQEELSEYTERMEHQTSILDHYRSLLDLTGQSQNFKAIGTVLEGQVKTIENSYQVAKENYEWLANEAVKKKQAMNDALARGDVEAAKLYESEWKAAEEKMREAQDNMLSMAEEWAEKLREVLENKLAEIADILENTLTGGRSFDELSMQMEHAQGIQEEYLTTTNKIYETNKMIRNIQNEIDKTTNTVAKQKLKAFQQETQQLQNQNQLSQFELDIQQKKYDLLLAKIALEEAQNAKSTVRLQRDSEGNFGYIYTADQNQVSGAEQTVEDAENALYNARLEGANNYASQRQELLQGLYDSLTNLDNQYYVEGTISEEEYNRQKEAIQNYYFERLTQNSELYAIATGEDATISQKAWSTALEIMNKDADDWVKAVDDYLYESQTIFNQYQTEINKVSKKTGVDLNTLASNVKDITDESDNLTKKVKDEVIPELQNELNKVSEVTDNYALHRGELQLVIEKYEGLITKIGTAITEMGKLDKACDNVKTSAEQAASAVGRVGNVAPQASSNPGNTTNNYVAPSGSHTGYYLSGSWNQFSAGQELTANANVRVTEIANGSLYYCKVQSKDGKISGWLRNPETVLSGFSTASWVAGSVDRSKYYTLDYKKLDTHTTAYDTGGYTGEWGPEGKWALLHQKELVLNAHQTEDLLMTMELLDSIIKQIDMMTMNNKISQMNAAMNETVNAMYREQMAQEIHIEANFPNATDRNEIYQALEMLANDASQFINR